MKLPATRPTEREVLHREVEIEKRHLALLAIERIDYMPEIINT